MKDVSTLNNTKSILNKYGFHFKKSFGQNFLIDTNILKKIVSCAEINKKTAVIEIGPGIGALTEQIARCAGKVLAYEIDNRLIPILNETLSDYDNVEIVNQDILKVDIKKEIDIYLKDFEEIVVIANLPYYITTPILMHFIDCNTRVKRYVVMMQKEVAERMSAKPSTKEYNSLSIAIQFLTKPKIVMKVPKSVFIPQPNVDSSVLRLDVLEEPSVKVKDKKLFFKVVKGSFVQRRKTIFNNLNTSFKNIYTKEQIRDILHKAKIEERRRGESLSIQEFANLANILYEFGN